MKYINLKLLLLGLITPLLCGVSFAFDLTADEVNYLNNNSLNIGSFNNVNHYVLYDGGSSHSDQNICVIFSGLTFTNNNIPFYSIIVTNNYNTSSYSATTYDGATYPYFLYCTSLISGVRYISLVQHASSSYKTNFNVDKFWVLNADKIIDGHLGFDVQGLLNSYNQCSNDLNHCDTSVQQCLIDKESLSGSLASCNADKVSLNNNIDSLTLQLQNCLGQSCEGSGDNGTGLVFNQYSLYRTDDEIDYSTPITNNLFLPLGYKGKINEDNILSISKINTLEASYQFSEEDKVNIIDIFTTIMIFLLATGGLISIILFLKRLFLKR